MKIDETMGWNINPYGDTWRITTDAGDFIADGIPDGTIAHYIANMHNTKVRNSRNFRVVDNRNIPADDGDTNKQCSETAHPYRCMHGVGHTGPHVSHGVLTDYLFD